MLNTENNQLMSQNSLARLPRILSPLETWGFGLSGLLLWLGTAPSMHAELGTGAIFVWLPGTIVGILLNFQVKRLGLHWPEMSGGTPNYAARLLRKYPAIARYGAIGYFLGWVSVPSMNAIILTQLIQANLAPVGIYCPQTTLKIALTALPYILAFSGTSALAILHLCFILPSIGFLLLFCFQGLGWLAISEASPGFFPAQWSGLTPVEWAKWFFIAVYAVCGCETASSFAADSRRPTATLKCLSFAAWAIAPVYLGGSWLLMRLADSNDNSHNAFLNLSAAAKPFWGDSAAVLVTFLIAAGCLLSSATAVCNAPRVLYQLALDKQLSPVFAVVSPRGVLQPALIFTFFLSLLCLIWGDVDRVVMVTGTGYLSSIIALHLGLWLRRRQAAALCPRWALGFFVVEVFVLIAGGLAWHWADWLVGLLLPPLILAADASTNRLNFAPFHAAWWLQRRDRASTAKGRDFVGLQLGILILLVCGATALSWILRSQLDGVPSQVSGNIFVVFLIVIAFTEVAIACWTTLPQVAAIAAAREEAENLSIAVLDTVVDTILVLNEKGVIRQANQAAEELFASSADRLFGHRLSEFFPDLKGTPQQWASRSEQNLSYGGGNSRTIEATISQTKNRHICEYIVILRDISDRKQAEAALQHANAYLSAVIDNLVDGLLVTDLDRRIAQFNPAGIAMFGLQGTDPIGRDCRELFNANLADLVEETRFHPRQVFAAEIELANQRIGHAVATSICKNASTNAADECIGSVILIRDITAEKEVDRMKTDFISTVSHELRTPLTSVLGFASLIETKLKEEIFPLIKADDRKTQRAIRQVGGNINIIISEAERLTALVNDVLDIAKMEAGKVEWHFQPISIQEIIERAIAATSSLFEAKGLQSIAEIEPDLPEVTGDRDRLIQVVINLISNAIKFTDSGSCTLKARWHRGDIIVSVADTGIGIAPGDREKVFEKFKQVGDTLTDKPKGTGLGLPICKQIITHHGGRIWVESTLGEGSTFFFTLPASANASLQEDKININTLVKQLKDSLVQTAPSHGDGHKTILVVDDDSNIRELLRQELEASGYAVREAKDGMGAISQVKREKPDLIVLDVMMPHMNGFDVAAVLKNDPETAAIPIVILSIIEDRERGYRLGIDRYLTKPINRERLLEDIRLLLSQGKSNKKVLVVDRDASTLRIVSDVLQAQGYSVIEAGNVRECIEKAVSAKPDLIIVDSVFSQEHALVKTLRFEKGLENVLFILMGGSS